MELVLLTARSGVKKCCSYLNFESNFPGRKKLTLLIGGNVYSDSRHFENVNNLKVT